MRPAFKRNSCVVLIGTAGNGKTTTMNIYAGTNDWTSSSADQGTTTNVMRQDQLPEHQQERKAYYPAWLDTIGFDAPSNQKSNRELSKDYLKCIRDENIDWLHAVVWCIAPSIRVRFT